MKIKKRKELEKKGFHIGSASEFLNLSPEEEAYIEIRLDMSELVKDRRIKKGWTQEELAKTIGSSQSRVAKLESGDSGISLDLMIKSLLSLGVSKEDIGEKLKGTLKPV